jgi:hypothetical protein
MTMINTNNLAPWNWGPDITLREHYAIVDNRAIADRYNRGIWIFRDLLATPWYRLATRRAYKTQLRNLRGEYRELLKSWVADHRPRRPSPLPPRRAQTAMPERVFEVPAITTLNDPGPYDVMRDEYHVDIARDEPARRTRAYPYRSAAHARDVRGPRRKLWRRRRISELGRSQRVRHGQQHAGFRQWRWLRRRKQFQRLKEANHVR